MINALWWTHSLPEKVVTRMMLVALPAITNLVRHVVNGERVLVVAVADIVTFVACIGPLYTKSCSLCT